MELIERLPLKEIHFLNDLDYKTFKNYTSNCKNEDERKRKFDILKHYCNTNIKARGEIKRLYSYTQSTPLEVGGRLYCGNSIQGLPKDIRGLILRNVSTDIDMKNAHPVILRYLCKLHNIPCPNLSWYIDNRDDVLKEFGAEGKSEFLKAINDDKLNKKIKHSFFKDFDKECKAIQVEITKLSVYSHIVNSVPTVRTYNWLGSAINRVLCVFENKILQEVINFCNRKQIEICSLMFDGLMMYGNHYENDELLKGITEHVASKFAGLNMVWCYKEHSQVIQIPDDYVMPEIKQKELINTFEIVSKEFEKSHCKIINKSCFIKETESDIVMLSRQQIVTSYESMTYEKQNKDDEIVTDNFIINWLKNNPEQRCYEDIGCYPDKSKCPDNHFNSWKPFAMELVETYEPKPEELEIIKKHIKILCGNDETVATYFEAWVAQMIQYPAIKTVCPVLISKEGAGKGSLMRLLEKMIGHSKVFETATPSRDIWGDFNGRMASTFLVNLNELSKKETTESEGRIKALITDPKLTINNKGVNQYDINSFHRFIITTNKEEPVNTGKDDRRKFIIRSSDELIGNEIYFTKLHEMLSDVDVIKTCYEYFKSIPDMDKFAKLALPCTEYQEQLKEMSVSPIENWIQALTLEHYYEETVELADKQQYILFKEWCVKCGIDYNLSTMQFGVRIKRLSIDGVIFGKYTNKGTTRIFQIDKLKKYFKLNNIEDETNDEVIENEN